MVTQDEIHIEWGRREIECRMNNCIACLKFWFQETTRSVKRLKGWDAGRLGCVDQKIPAQECTPGFHRCFVSVQSGSYADWIPLHALTVTVIKGIIIDDYAANWRAGVSDVRQSCHPSGIPVRRRYTYREQTENGIDSTMCNVNFRSMVPLAASRY